MDGHLKKTLTKAVARIMKPIVKLWLKKGMSYKAFEEVIRWTFVSVAKENFALEGKKITDSRISVITGLTRHQAHHYRTVSLEESPEKAKSNRSTRVLTGWLTDPKYRGKELKIEGGIYNFTSLVKKYGGDISYKAVLDDLLHQGSVEQTKSGSLHLVTRGHIPDQDESAIIEIVGHDISTLIATLEHNLNSEKGQKFFQKKVCYDNIPKSFLPTFKKLSGEKGQALLEELNEILANAQDETVDKESQMKTGMGVYYFEDKPDDD